MPEQTPLAADYVKVRETRGVTDFLEQMRRDYVPSGPAVAGAAGKAAGAAGPAAAPDASERVPLASTALGKAGAAAKDIAVGVTEIPTAMFAGFSDAADELATTVGQAFGVDMDALDENFIDAIGIPFRGRLEQAGMRPESTTGKAIAAVSQFTAAMIPAAKGLKAIGLAGALGRTGTAVAAGALADAAAFDEHADRIANMVEAMPAMSNPLTGWLAADADDGVLEGKIKQVIEGAGVGVAGEAVMGGLRVFKRLRDGRKLLPQAEGEAGLAAATRKADDPVQPPVELTQRDWLALGGRPDEPLFKVGEGVERRGARLVQERTPDEIDAMLDTLRVPSRAPKPQGLLGFLRSRGGLKDDGGELAARNLRTRYPGLVNNKAGLSLEEAAQAAEREGFFPTETRDRSVEAVGGSVAPGDVDRLLRGLDDELGGTAVNRLDDPAALMKSRLQEFQDVLDEIGVSPRDATNAQIKAALAARSAPAGPVEPASAAAGRLVGEAEAEGLDLAAAPARTGEELARETADPGYAAGVGDTVPGRIKIGEKVGNINLARLTTEDDVRDVIRQTAEAYQADTAGSLTTVRQSTADARALADTLMLDPEKVRTLIGEGDGPRARPGASPSGRAFTREEVIATGELVAQNGRSLKLLADKIVSGKATDIEKLALKRGMAFHEGLLRTVSGQAREAGRALQAFQTAVGSGPRDLSAEAIRNLLADGVPVERLAGIVHNTTSTAQVNALALGSRWRNVGDAIFESWRGSKLLSPWSHARNITGNTLSLVGQIPERFIAGQIGSRTAGGEVARGEAAEMAYGLVTGMRDALSAGYDGLRTGLAADASVKAEVGGGVAGSNRAISAGKLRIKEDSALGRAVDFYGEYINGAGFRGLVGADEFYKSLAISMQTNALALRRATAMGLKGDDLAAEVARLKLDPPGDLLDEAIDFSRYITYQSPGGEVARAVNALRQKTPMGRYVIPFLQTPANVLSYQFERTPFAVALPSWRRDIAAGGAKRDLALAKIGFGSVLTGTIASMFADGHLTGAAPTEPAKRQQWDREGKLPYAALIKGKWVQYSSLDNIGMSLGMVADFAQMLDVADDVKGLAQDPKALDDAYAELIKEGYSPEAANAATQGAEAQLSSGFTKLPGVVVQSFVYNTLEKSYLSGLSNLAEAIYADEPGQAVATYLRDMAVSFVPLDAPLRFVERLTDPELRDAVGVWQALKIMTPGLSKSQPEIPNLWGEPRRSTVAYSPFGTKDAKPTGIDAEMERVGFAPTMPQKVIGGVKLNGREYAEYVRLAGNELKFRGRGAKDTLEALVSGGSPGSAAYARASDGPEGGKALIMRDVLEKYRQAAGLEMQRRHAELRVLVEQGKVAAARAKQSPAIGAPPSL